jgi:glutamine synthetase
MIQPHEVAGVAEAMQIVNERKLSHVKIGLFDLDGVLRGKHIGRDKFVSALEDGFKFCDVLLGWDSSDRPYDNVKFTGWHTAYPDMQCRIVPRTCRALPLEADTLFFLGEFAGPAEELCPRGVLKRVLARADAMGFGLLAACEYEFFLFEETPNSVREKGYRNLKTITPGSFGYSVLRSSVHDYFYHELLHMCEAMRLPLEGLHTETGPGVLEAALTHVDALEGADRAALFKTFVKVLAQQRGWMATFMARWSSDWPGQSGHLHISLTDRRGRPVFHDPNRPHAISDEMRWFIGGQQALMPELLAMVASTINSYARITPGFWAPTNATWGIENRTCALRVIPGPPKSQRIEYRIAPADINPYLATAAAVGSGLWGIENRIEPDAAVEGNAYALDVPESRQLPGTLWEAAQRLKTSQVARILFGDTFVDHYAATREWEEREYRKAVTDWQLARYFEII